jgi:hypothetical protein
MASDPKSSPAKFRYGGVFNDDLSRGISLFVYLASLPLSSPVVYSKIQPNKFTRLL